MSRRARVNAPPPIPRQAWKVEVWMQVEDGEIFEKLMKKRGFTQASLARSVRCSRPMIGYLIRGERNCTPTLAHRIAEALELPLEVIFLTSVSRDGVRSSASTSRRTAA